jgi:uncharacterized damage-inducible protein DinB
VRSLGPDALAEPVDGSGWPALRNALFHIAAAWDEFLREAAGARDALDQTAEDMRTWDDLQAYRAMTRGWLRRIIDDTPDDALLADSHPMFAGTRAETRTSTAEILAHILLHERGHHGDVSTLIAQLGGTPPPVDYLTFLFFERNQRR